MARTIRNAKIDSPSARSKLTSNKSGYWITLSKGLSFGYRKGASGRWAARMIHEKERRETIIGMADDTKEADGVAILSFAQAQDKAHKWFANEVRIKQGHEPANRGPYTVTDAMRDYMTHYSIEGKAVKETQLAINAHIIPALGRIEISKLTTKQIVDWHHGMAARPAALRTRANSDERNFRELDSKDTEAVRRRRASANRIMTRLKAALNYAWNNGKVTNDAAWRKVKPFKNVDAPVIRYLSEEECVRLANTCPPELRRIVQGALYTGCRYGELGSLRVADYNPDAGRIVIRTSKSGKPRHVVLTEEGQQFFENITAGKQGSDLIFTHDNGAAWGKSHQSRPLSQACKRAKIKPAISFHILRHTHGSLLAMKGVPLPVIAQQLGHSDTRMTEKHYAHLSPSYVADTIRQHFPKLGLGGESNIKKLKARN